MAKAGKAEEQQTEYVLLRAAWSLTGSPWIATGYSLAMTIRNVGTGQARAHELLIALRSS